MNDNKSDLIEIAEWEDPDENNGEWPYPDRWVRSVVTGELADRCRKALGVDDLTAEVTITEHVVSGGYSEFTQENFTDFTIACAGQEERFDESWHLPSELYRHGSTFAQLLHWLDAADGKTAR